MFLTQEQIDVLSQNLRKKRLRVELLTTDFKTVDSIEGYAVNGSISVTADSDTRRSGNVTLAIPLNYAGSTFLDKIDGLVIDYGGKIWLDKNIRIYVGIDDINSPDPLNPNTIWYNLGTFLIDQPTREFSSTSYSISFQCIDLMARYTGIRQGQLTDLSVSIPQGEYVIENGQEIFKKTELQEALTAVITDIANIQNFSIYPIPDKYKYLPYDISVGSGATVYDLLNEFMSILSTWQMYFDVDGTFIIEPIPSGVQDIVYDIEGTQMITDNLSVDFQNVKNQVIVYGRLNELNYFTNNVELELNVVGTFANTSTTVEVNQSVWQSKINQNISNGTFTYGGTDGTSTDLKWQCSWDSKFYSTSQLPTLFGITVTGDVASDDYISISYTIPETNVSYTQNDDNTYTLNLNFSALQSQNFTIGGTTFGFQSVDTYNTLPISKVNISVDNEQLLSSNLVYYENTNIAFGKQYENNYVPVNIVTPNEIFFITIYDATLNADKTINLEQPVTFQFMGKQQSAYCMVNDNLESPFYINNGINATNFYCGTSYTQSSSSATMQLTLNNDSTVTTLENGTIITFMSDRTYNGAYTISILSAEGNSIVSNIPIVSNYWNNDGTRTILQSGKFTNNYTVISLKYEPNTSVVDSGGTSVGTGAFVYLGRTQTALTLICTGGEYDNISADQLAYERCLYELFIHSNLNDTISISIIPNYSLDVNCRIPYDPNNAMPYGLSQGLQFFTQSTSGGIPFITALGNVFYVQSNIIEYFITKQITFPLGLDNTAQTITAARIYDSGNLIGSDYE